jgi:hypothetical protein
MNYSSTDTPQWKVECEELRKQGIPFTLCDVRTIEHMAFVQAFCMALEWTAKQEGESVLFSPPPKN